MIITLRKKTSRSWARRPVSYIERRRRSADQKCIGRGLARQWRRHKGQLREAIRLLDEQQEPAALATALLATPKPLLADFEAALGLALPRARDRICTHPSKAEYDSSQAQALELLEKFHTEVRQIISA
jgi:hypothetical protein